MFRVLTVDDESYFHEGLDRLIDWESLGFRRVGQAGNGSEGRDAFLRERPHLVITDIRMPVMDGLEMIEAIGELDAVPPVFIIISGYSDFAYAKRAMKFGVNHYVLKPIDEDELIEILKGIHRELEEREESVQRAGVEYRLSCSAMIRRLILGEPEKGFLDHARKHLKIRGGVRYWNVVFDNAPGEGDLEIVLRKSLWSLGLYGCVDHIYTEVPGIYGVLMGDHDLETAKRPVAEIPGEIVAACRRMSSRSLSLAVGGRYDDLGQLHMSYREAKIALAHDFYRDGSAHIDYEQIRDTDLDRAVKGALFFPDLIEAIEKGDLRRIDESLDMIFIEFDRRNSAPDVIDLWLRSLAIDLNRIVVELDGTPGKELSRFSHYRFEPEKTDRAALRQHVGSICRNEAEELERLRRINRTGVISSMTDYLKRNYADDVSLKSLGELFGMNPVYLGQLFKNTLGVSYKNYLRNLRMEEACRLLNRTDLRVYEVARSVGYKDSDYFTGQFEAVKGMTPGEYRKNKF